MAEQNISGAAENAPKAVFSDFVQSRLDMVDWDALKRETGVDRKYILGNQRIGEQLANGQVTDFVPCNLTTAGGARVLGNVALQATFFKDEYKIRSFTPSPEPELTVYGDRLMSETARANLTKVFNRPVRQYDEEGNVVKDKDGKDVILGYEKVPEYANGGVPITLKHRNADGEEVAVKHLVSLDAVRRDRSGKIYRGTNRLFTIPCENVERYLEKAAPKMYGHEFTKAQVHDLAEGKDVLIKDFRTKGGKVFEAVVQFDAVSRKVVAVEPEWWRKTQSKARSAERELKPEKPVQQAAPQKTAVQQAAPGRARRG